MGDANPIHTLRDYSRPSHEGYSNTIELPKGNNMVPLSDTIWLVQNGCSFHGLRFEDPNQHLKDFLKLVDSLDLDVVNRERKRLHLFQFSLRDQARNWLEHLPAGFISTWEDLTTRNLSQDVPSTSDRRLIKLKNQVQRLREAHLAPKQPIQVYKIISSREIYNGPYATQYCIENPEQACVDYASSVPTKREASGLVSNFMSSQDARLSKFEADFKQQQNEMTNKIDTVLKAITNRMAGALPSDTVKNPKLNANLKPASQKKKSKMRRTTWKTSIPTLSSPPDPPVSFITEKVSKLNSFFESLGLVPQSSDTEFVCTKGDDGDVMFIEIIKNNDDSHKEEPEVGENAGVRELEVEYFDIFPTRSSKAHLHEDKQIPSVEVFDKVSFYTLFRGNTRDLDSFGEETDKNTTLHHLSRRIVHTEREDGVPSIKSCRHDLSSDDVVDFVMASERSSLKTFGADSSQDLEGDISNDEIKKAVWDCGSNKSSGPDGFTFEFLKKIMAPSWKEQALLFKVEFQKAFDSVRWDHLDDILGKFGFGSKLRGWIRGCLHSSKASVLVNGSPADELLLHRGALSLLLSSVVLPSSSDRWSWTLNGHGDFLVKSAREEIDKHLLVTSSSSTRWSKLLPIKLNLFVWRMFLDKLPTRINLSNRDLDIPCVLCPNCGNEVESRNHLFFDCSMALDLFRLLGRWWNIDIINLINPFFLGIVV
uniref:RNA-directed DNA polymerase, eukaryota, reverse transcriptase zinc-binding domain protein n=1 Tax=Tanacetum cinerariifolium TaxID=118510 RepID=A0A6L2J147_TANCI|nr:RNA-directed DNA polymerase, eukaryota, reverse transcriptase zinc-binding domain protein [Tanacetum cinerariifolium]